MHSILQQDHLHTIHGIQESESSGMFVAVLKIAQGRFGALNGGPHQLLQFFEEHAMGTGKTVAPFIFATISTRPNCRKGHPNKMVFLVNNAIRTGLVSQCSTPSS